MQKTKRYKKNVILNSNTIIKNDYKQMPTISKKVYSYFRKKYHRIKQMTKCTFETQIEVFEGSMRYFLLVGKFLGLFPLIDITSYGRLNKPWPFWLWRYLSSFAICSIQSIAVTFCFIKIMNDSVTIGRISYLSFYGTTCLSSVLILRLASNWHVLMKQVEAAELNGYVDPYVKFNCNFATFTLLWFALLEHILSNTAKFLTVLNCLSGNENVYEQFIFKSYSWIFESGLSYSVTLGFLLPVLNAIITLNWSYSQVFVICISLYLTSIIKQINKKILSFDGQYLSTSYWRILRQDYNRATRLVGSFDNVSNSIVFASFASNLFFVCLQLYNILRNDTSTRHGVPLCPNNNATGSYYKYEQIVTNAYFIYSSLFVVVRTFFVSIIAAEVHSVSLEVAPVLYNVPSPTYCLEVHRFVEQIHGNKVALTGLKFFYVTKELVLSMVGTIVTYELVLLQFT